jgi:hypothetical protein
MTPNYVAQVIIFLAALLAVRGATWNSKEKGFKKITLTGYLSILFAIAGLIVSLKITFNSEQDSRAKSEKLNQTVEHTRQIKSSLQAAKAQIDSYKSILDVIRSESVRQPQQVMAQYVELRPNRFWMAPNHIYGGSIVKLYGFRSDVIILYGSNLRYEDDIEYLIRRCVDRLGYSPYSGRESVRIRDVSEMEYCFSGRVKFSIISPQQNSHSEVAVIGPSGVKMGWGLMSLADKYDGGKVFVESTPRIRSEDWSWVEEIKDSINRIKKITLQSEVQVIVEKLNMRNRPNMTSSIIVQLVNGDELKVNKKKGIWLNVENSSGEVGWVHGGYVEIVQE